MQPPDNIAQWLFLLVSQMIFVLTEKFFIVQVTVWRCDKGADLDTTILQALIKSISNTQTSDGDADDGDNAGEKDG